MFLEEKINQIASDYKVIGALVDKILSLNFDLEKIEIEEEGRSWHYQSSDYFRTLEKRNEIINMISDIINENQIYETIWGHFPRVRVHKVDVSDLFRRQMKVLTTMEKALAIAAGEN